MQTSNSDETQIQIELDIVPHRGQYQDLETQPLTQASSRTSILILVKKFLHENDYVVFFTAIIAYLGPLELIFLYNSFLRNCLNATFDQIDKDRDTELSIPIWFASICLLNVCAATCLAAINIELQGYDSWVEEFKQSRDLTISSIITCIIILLALVSTIWISFAWFFVFFIITFFILF